MGGFIDVNGDRRITSSDFNKSTPAGQYNDSVVMEAVKSDPAVKAEVADVIMQSSLGRAVTREDNAKKIILEK